MVVGSGAGMVTGEVMAGATVVESIAMTGDGVSIVVRCLRVGVGLRARRAVQWLRPVRAFARNAVRRSRRRFAVVAVMR